jgi:hypothetical protein
MLQSWIVNRGGQLVLLSLLIPLALAQDAPELRAFYEPICDQTSMAPADDCQAAINGIWAFRGGVNVAAGCVEVFESGGCVVEVCNMEGDGSSIDYMGIAPAAQSVAAYCREGGDRTAGATKIVGFEQGSQGYSSAEVRLRPPMVGGPPDVPTRRRTIEERKRGTGEGSSKELEIRPRDGDRPREYSDQDHPGVSPYVEAEFGLFREGEGQFHFTYLILPQTRSKSER